VKLFGSSVATALALLALLGNAAGCSAPCTQESCPIGTVCSANGACEKEFQPPPGGEGEGEGGNGGEGEGVVGGEGEGEGQAAAPICGVPSLTFSPTHTYIIGSLEAGATAPVAIADVAVVDTYVVGLGDVFSIGMLSNGTVVYLGSAGFMKFVPDVSAPVANPPANDPVSSCNYPADPAANDTALPTPGCDATSGVQEFHVQDGTHMLYHCNSPDAWFDDTGASYLVPSGAEVVAFDAAFNVLLKEGGNYSVLAPTDATTPTNGLPQIGFIDARSTPNSGFLIAGSPLPAQGLGIGIFQIAPDGTTTAVGTVTPPTNPLNITDLQLSPDGTALLAGVAPTSGATSFAGTVVNRYGIDGSVTELFDDTHLVHVGRVHSFFGAGSL
jgi:hypothetical protein